MFRDLNKKEEQEFKQWARDNYEPRTEITTAYHPVVQAECELINQELEDDFADIECSICKNEIEKQLDEDGDILWDHGHNAEPVTEGRCCNDCNMNVVIPARITMMLKNRKS